MEHSEFYRLFTHYWWLILVFFGMGIGVFRSWTRHLRAQRALDLLKSYVDQGKEPPPQLIALLEGRDERNREARKNYRSYGWIPVFLFAGLCSAFVLLGVTEIFSGDDGVHFFFVALIMLGLCLGNLATVVTRQRQDQDRTPRP